jgi:hypothetical protein
MAVCINRWIWRATATAIVLKQRVVLEKKALRIGEIHELRRDRPPALGAPAGQAWLLAAAGGCQPSPRGRSSRGTFRWNAAGSR